MTASVEVENAHLRYGSVTAISDMSFTLQPERIYGLLGRNGSGKTSLLSLLAGFQKPTAGRVAINGENPFENESTMKQTCFIRESGNTYQEDICAGGALALASLFRTEWDAGYAASLARLFQLPLDRDVSKLSRGQRSALGITLGLASRTGLTIIDEAYLGMDAPSRELFYTELLREYSRWPRTVILSTHLIDEVSPMLEEILIIDQGRLIAHEDRDTICARGVWVTGSAEVVDSYVADMTCLCERELGRTKSVMVYGFLDDEQRHHARNRGLELSPVGLQELFTHLTAGEEVDQ